MACILGPIVQPVNQALFEAIQFPFKVTFQVGSSTPLNNFTIQVSNTPSFSVISGYVVSSSSSISYINIDNPGTYYIRISCNGTSWSPITSFTVDQIEATNLSTITSFTATINTTSDGFVLTIPQLRSGPIVNTSLVPTSSVINYLRLIEVQVSTDSTFQTGIARYYFEQTKFGDLYTVEITDIPNFSLNNVYYFRLRLYDTQNQEWEPYTNMSISYIGAINDKL